MQGWSYASSGTFYVYLVLGLQGMVYSGKKLRAANSQMI